MRPQLKSHQSEALEEMGDGRILKGGVGSGKSHVAMAYYVERVLGGWHEDNQAAIFDNPVDLYVITTAKKRDDKDWEKLAAQFAISTVPENSWGGVKIKVDSWHNIQRYQEVENAFFIFDEQRLVGSGAWVKAFYKIAKKNRWIMLSATPGDDWLDYIPVFVANGYYRNKTEFLNEHVVWKRFAKYPKIDYYVNINRLQINRSKVLVEMPFERHTKRHVHNILVDYDKELFDRVWIDRWHVYEDRPLRDAGEMYMVGRKVVNDNVSRIAAVMELLEKHPRLIIFYNFNFELGALRTLASTLEYPVAEWNGHKHQAIPDTTKWMYIVQYTAGAEAWECTDTDAMVFYSLNYSYKINEQAKGRIDRMNTPFSDLRYYILRTGSQIDNAIVKALSKKTDFNEKAFASSAWGG